MLLPNSLVEEKKFCCVRLGCVIWAFVCGGICGFGDEGMAGL